ncbi:hypothetical protein NKH77_14880 [Streptomyces sp. M19]
MEAALVDRRPVRRAAGAGRGRPRRDRPRGGRPGPVPYGVHPVGTRRGPGGLADAIEETYAAADR